jgi:hypothetical protein
MLTALFTESPTATVTAAATTFFVLYLAYVRSVRYNRVKELEAMPDPLVAGFRTGHQIMYVSRALRSDCCGIEEF